MALSSEHLPLTRSLRARALELHDPGRDPIGGALETADLITYLARSKDSDRSPLATIQGRAALQDREAALTRADHAALTWVCEAFEAWEEKYPIEAPVSHQLHRLLPLAVAMALTDETFFTPGLHPLHQLLDALQTGAVGWQRRLDRAGQMLEQRIERSVEKALEWFGDHSIDLPAITQELLAANERDTARAQRMVDRLAETEEARLRTLTARHDAAQFLNQSLEFCELPAAIGEFIKGPWYDSAQLVLVKHGPDSTEWEQMQRTTRELVESVGDPGGTDEAPLDRREQIHHLPAELRRWLLSLEHDSEGADSAIGLVEYAHLRLQHGQHLPRVSVAPLPVEPPRPVDLQAEEEATQTGDWFRFEDEDGELRARLVLCLEDGHHLVFANFVGLKALDLPRRKFKLHRETGVARHLPDQATFSLSLAAAAGIDSETALRSFLDPDAAPLPEGGTADPGLSTPDADPADAAPPLDADEDRTPPADAETGGSLELELAPDDLPSPAEHVAEPFPEPEPEPAASALAAEAPKPEPAPAPAPAPEPPPSPPPARPSPDRTPRTDREVDIPMGTWLGFHDEETPIMAKLAVFDPRRDSYIFVNRKGIALRELNRAELLDLMDRGLLDILETKSYFREEVQRARGEDR